MEPLTYHNITITFNQTEQDLTDTAYIIALHKMGLIYISDEDYKTLNLYLEKYDTRDYLIEQINTNSEHELFKFRRESTFHGA